MPERSTISQVVQIGVETTPGTAVAASKRLTGMSIEPNPEAEMDQFRPMGQKYNALSILNKEWVEADISGKPTYTEIVYPLSSLLKSVTPTQIMDGATPTGAYTWLFEPSSTEEDTVKTFTVEQGGSVRAHRFAYGLVNELGLTFSREGTDLSGTMLGRRITDAITLTASPTDVPLVPIIPSQVDIFLDTTSAGIGATKLTRVASVEWGLSGRFNPLWILDSSQASFAGHVEGEPDLSSTISLMADATGMAFLDRMRDGATRFMRIRATGEQIYAGGTPVNHSLTIDMAVKVADPGGFSDEDGVYNSEWDLVGVHDATWGRAFRITVVNNLASL